jgi:hypothetical protein
MSNLGASGEKCAVRLIPPVVSAQTRSHAEREVFGRIAETDLARGSVALHSLNISEHDYKIAGELDFVVVGPNGLFVLEVKGGAVRRHQGIWTFTDRYGNQHKRMEGPFDQARSGMFALRDRLRREIGEDEIASVVFGFGVLFPDFTFDRSSVEWATETIFDATDGRGHGDLALFLTGLASYWAKKNARAEVVTPELVTRIVNLLRPSFDKIPALRVRTSRLTQGMVELTAEQFRYLDFVEGNPRLLCSGGAGTGKTFLAVEVARRHAARGRTVLVVCASQILQAFLDSWVSSPSIHVRSMRSLESRPKDLAPYDVLVIDEGQDVLNVNDVILLDECLQGGLKNGMWSLFYDSNMQSGLIGTFQPEILATLAKDYGAINASLNRNCRNTATIVTQTRLLTAADVGKPAAGEGPAVRFEYYRDGREQVAVLEREIARLRSEMIAPGEVTILSATTKSASCATQTSLFQKGELMHLTPKVAANWPPGRVTYCSIADFKGLENTFVIVTDIDDLEANDQFTNNLYVAMSRAQAGLCLIVHDALKSKLKSIAQANYARSHS